MKLQSIPKPPDLSKAKRLVEAAVHRARLAALPPLPTAAIESANPALQAATATEPARAAPKPVATRRIASGLWSALIKPFRLVNWRIVAAALFGTGILHILATLAAPHLATATAYDRLESVLPANTMIVLPQIASGAQPLPFMSPALRYAMCRYDTTSGPVALSVELRETGSSLTVYSAEGEAVYTAAQSEVPQHRLLIVPADGRFLGLTPEARGQQRSEILSASLAANRGIAVFAVPDRGASYRSAAEAQLAAATCQPRKAFE